MSKIFKFKNEAAMCAAFISVAQKLGWTAYPETCDYDIVLVDPRSGVQVAVEAKQTFNPHVLDQITDRMGRIKSLHHPDYYAVLVPDGGTKGLTQIAEKLGVSVIRAVGEPMEGKKNWTEVTKKGLGTYGTQAFQNMVPNLLVESAGYAFDNGRGWTDHWPLERLPLPDYIPDVSAGNKSPVRLTAWKIRAIKICILLEKRGWLTQADFNDLNISMSIWKQGWLNKGEAKGVWVGSKSLPDFKAQHPTNYAQILADYDIWAKELKGRPRPDLQLGLSFQANQTRAKK